MSVGRFIGRQNFWSTSQRSCTTRDGRNAELLNGKLVLDRRPDHEPMNVGMRAPQHGGFLRRGNPREERDVRRPRVGRLEQGRERQTETLAPRHEGVVVVAS